MEQESLLQSLNSLSSVSKSSSLFTEPDEIHYRVRKNLVTVPLLSRTNGPSERTLPSDFPTENSVCVSNLANSSYMSRPSHPRFHRPYAEVRDVSSCAGKH